VVHNQALVVQVYQIQLRVQQYHAVAAVAAVQPFRVQQQVQPHQAVVQVVQQAEQATGLRVRSILVAVAAVALTLAHKPMAQQVVQVWS
jgi:hypothetical protein